MSSYRGIDIRSNVYYWRMDEEIQNFGDFISKFMTEELFYPYNSEVRSVHIVGSVLDDMFVPLDEIDTREIVFWGCGLRGPGGLSEDRRERANILSVRGPLSASELNLGSSVPIGDPGLLLPALYRPSHVEYLKGRTICIPHFYDTRSDEVICDLSGCDYVIRTNIKPEIGYFTDIIDCINSCEFILTSSLHGAIVASAFGKPFAYWDNESIDIPFKWHDFAESISIPVKFTKNLEEGIDYYNDVIKNTVSIPNMLATLVHPPLPLRLPGLLKVVDYELSRKLGDRDLGDFKKNIVNIAKLRHIHEDPVLKLLSLLC